VIGRGAIGMRSLRKWHYQVLYPVSAHSLLPSQRDSLCTIRTVISSRASLQNGAQTASVPSPSLPPPLFEGEDG